MSAAKGPHPHRQTSAEFWTELPRGNLVLPTDYAPGTQVEQPPDAHSQLPAAPLSPGSFTAFLSQTPELPPMATPMFNGSGDLHLFSFQDIFFNCLLQKSSSIQKSWKKTKTNKPER